MFGFGNPLWKLLKGPLKKILADNFSVLSGRFKALLSSTENDLIAVTKEKFPGTGLSNHFTYADIGRRGEGKSIRFYLFPLNAIDGSSQLRDELAARLKDNVDLGAARNGVGIQDADWDNMIQQYSSDVLRLGLPYALKRIIDDKTEFSLGYHLIDIAKQEAIKVVKQDVSLDLVVLYRPFGGNPTSVSDAKKIWARRNDGAYEYKRDPKGYDGFKAP